MESSKEIISYYSILDKFKSEDNLSDAYPLLEDSALANLVQAWTKIKVEWDPPDEILDVEFKSIHNLWDDIWDYSDWNSLEISMVIGLPEDVVLDKHEKARKLRIIFPDGTIKNSARTVLNLKVTSVMRKAGVKNLKKGKEELPQRKKLKGASKDPGYDA